MMALCQTNERRPRWHLYGVTGENGKINRMQSVILLDQFAQFSLASVQLGRKCVAYTLLCIQPQGEDCVRLASMGTDGIRLTHEHRMFPSMHLVSLLSYARGSAFLKVTVSCTQPQHENWERLVAKGAEGTRLTDGYGMFRAMCSECFRERVRRLKTWLCTDRSLRRRKTKCSFCQCRKSSFSF